MEGEPPGVAAGLGLLQREADELVAQSGQDRLDQRVEDRRRGRCPRAWGRRGPWRRRERPWRCRRPSRSRRSPPNLPGRRGSLCSSTSSTSSSSVPSAIADSTSSCSQAGEPGLQTFGQPIARADVSAQAAAGRGRRPAPGRGRSAVGPGRAGRGPRTRSQLSSRRSATAAQLRVRDAELQRQRQGPFELGPFDELGVEGLEALVEVEVGGDLVLHGDRRREPGLDGVRGEHPLGEGVQRAQRGLVEVVEGGGEAAGVSSSSPARRWSATRTRWRNSSAAFSVNVMAAIDSIGDARRDQGHHPVDELRGLAGPGPGGHEQGRVQVGGDARADGLVGERHRGQGVESCLVAPVTAPGPT